MGVAELVEIATGNYADFRADGLDPGIRSRCSRAVVPDLKYIRVEKVPYTRQQFLFFWGLSVRRKEKRYFSIDDFYNK
jgi:hypothetical protein